MSAVTRNTVGFVYFIWDMLCRTVKVGYSGKPKARLATLQTATAGELRLLFQIPGKLGDEDRIQRKLTARGYHVRGEIFRIDDSRIITSQKLKEIAEIDQREEQWKQQTFEFGRVAA